MASIGPGDTRVRARREVPAALGVGAMDGTCVDRCTPHFGQRVSLVLFTLEVDLRPLPGRLLDAPKALGVDSSSEVTREQFKAFGIRSLAREEDWRLANALSEVSEAILNVSGATFDVLHNALDQEAEGKVTPPAFLRVPRILLMFLLLACQTVGAASHAGTVVRATTIFPTSRGDTARGLCRTLVTSPTSPCVSIRGDSARI